MTSEEKMRIVVEAADARQARDMVVLDLEGLTLMTGYFLICSGTSSTHVRSISDSVVERMKRSGSGGIRVEGYEAALWVLMDYGDVVVHVMMPEQREYYDLESFWKEARRVPLDLPAAARGE
ncbi:MAG: ribosome silencing factor [Chthonomonadales bacterium]|nr:ribosome silencing factor [Chthonomonadales bacterium]